MSQAKDDDSGFKDPVDVDAQNEQTQYIDLDPGEDFSGEITDVDLTRGYNGSVWIDGKELSLNATMRKQLLQSLVVGEDVLHEKDDEEQSFTNDDGEEVTFFEKSLRFK
jgi:hypothetical protein